MRCPMLLLLSLYALSQAHSLNMAEVMKTVIDRMNFTQYPLEQGRKILQALFCHRFHNEN